MYLYSDKSTFFFDLTKLEKLAKNDLYRFMEIMEAEYNTVLVLSKIRGKSFLLKPKSLFKAKIDIVYKVQYVRLAAKRDYFLYKQYGFKGLDLSLYPDLHTNNIKYNPLLEISNNKLTFKLED